MRSFAACAALLHAQLCCMHSLVAEAAGLKLERLQDMHLQQYRLCMSHLCNIGAEGEE